VKFGPWGAGGGTPCDINKISCPEYLVSVSIWSNETPGGCINGLSFTYVDQINEPISVGIGGCQEPWSVANILFPKKVITAGTWSTHCYRGGVKTVISPPLLFGGEREIEREVDLRSHACYVHQEINICK
jgi:hypothetical protein